MVGAGRQDGDAGIVPAAMCGQCGLQVLEVGREPHRVALLEQVRREVRVHDAVGEREADAGDCLGVVVDDAPLAIVAPRKVGRIELQMAGFRHDVLARA